MQIEWWYWIVTGVALLLCELAIPVFVLVWFGLGAILVGLFLLVLPSSSLTAQLALWLIVSSGLVVFWFKVFRSDQHKTRVGMSDAGLHGEIGLMVSAVAPFEKGEVRFQKPLLGSESWACIADAPIAAGDRVKVVQVEGSLLKVEKS